MDDEVSLGIKTDHSSVICFTKKVTELIFLLHNVKSEEDCRLFEYLKHCNLRNFVINVYDKL